MAEPKSTQAARRAAPRADRRGFDQDVFGLRDSLVAKFELGARVGDERVS